MPVFPIEQIEDSQQLIADAEIDLYELTPAGSIAKLYLKAGSDMDWLGNTYTGFPLNLTGESFNAEGQAVQPQLIIGQPDIDLSPFKGLIWDGTLDNARIDRHTVLLTHIENDLDIKRTRTYRVKRVDSYSSTQITLALAVFSVAGPSRMPFRQFIPPAFPYVRI